MVEVFKTNVTNHNQAKDIIAVIENHFGGYKVNFDLDDRDHILRVEVSKTIDTEGLIYVLKYLGVSAEVLPDEIEDIDLFLPDGRLMIR